MARVGFIGTGEIAAAMVHGLHLCGADHQIMVSRRGAATAAQLAREYPSLTIAENAAIVAGSDIVFLCLLARDAAAALQGLPYRADQTIFSVMVDMPLSRLQTLCAPARDIHLTIPLPPIAVGGCPLPVYPASPVLDALFGGRNQVIPQPSEAALNAHLAVSGICAAMLAQIKTAADWLGDLSGNHSAAEAYTCAMIRAYLPAQAHVTNLEASLTALSTQGGLNATLRTAMQPSALVLRAGLDGFRARLNLPDQDQA